MREKELESEADLNIKVETDEQENEPETDENVFTTPSIVRKRSGSLENIRPSVLATLDNTPSPNSRQKDRGEKNRRQNRFDKNTESGILLFRKFLNLNTPTTSHDTHNVSCVSCPLSKKHFKIALCV